MAGCHGPADYFDHASHLGSPQEQIKHASPPPLLLKYLYGLPKSLYTKMYGPPTSPDAETLQGSTVHAVLDVQQAA